MKTAARPLALALLLTLTAPAATRAQAPTRPLAGHVPAAALAHAVKLGRVADGAPVALALTLPPRDPGGLDDFLRRLHDPHDPDFGHFLTPEQFAARFGPTVKDYDAVKSWARAQGLAVTGTHPNRLILNVAGTAGAVQTALDVRLGRYRSAFGRAFRAPETDPRLPADVAGRVSGIVGLSTLSVRRPRARRMRAREAFASPASIGTGPNGGLSPGDIRAAYNLGGVGLNGAGQTLAVFELADYRQTDIDAYARAFGLNSVPRQNVKVDGGAALPADGSDEATLDIELQMALAPGASRILVYEGPNTDAGVLDTYSRIATDNQARQVSTSWGSPEAQVDAPTRSAEYAIFQQMAAQGQTVYAAAGDAGAFDDGVNLGVDDPASQPFVCGVGGTSLVTSGPGGAFVKESVWNEGSAPDGAGGGGVSAVWPLPDFQRGVLYAGSGASGAMRNVPDVALNADPHTGYAIFYSGAWHVYGGSSCAAPLWAGFTALVNQQRVAGGGGALGLASAALYRVATAGSYAQNFHDVADGSTNLYFAAVPGYDPATGLGSFNGAYLLASLSAGPAPGVGVVGGGFRAGVNFFSLPYDYPGLPLDVLLGYAGPRVARWDPNANQYALSPAPGASEIRLGQGYWARFPLAVNVTTPGGAADPARPFLIGLGSGWNAVGDPFPAAAPVAGLGLVADGQTLAFADAARAGLVDGTLYRYDASLQAGQGAYVAVTSAGALSPGQAYWLHTSRPLTLAVPPP